MGRTPRIAGVVGAVALIVAGPHAVDGQRRVDERQAIRPGGMIRIHNMVGSVRVTGWDRDTIAVTGVVRETSEDRFYFSAFGDGAKLGIAEATGDPGPSDLEVSVPASSSVWIKTASANVVVSGITGGVDLYSVTGTIRVEGSPREVQAESMGGEVSVDGETRSVRVRTASSGIRLRGTLLDVTVTTVSGFIDIEGERIQRARFESVDGAVHWSGDLARNASLDFITHSGPVEFALPFAASGEFIVNTFEGGLDNRIGAQVRRTGSKLKGSAFTFILGDGSATVSVRTFKGAVVLRGEGG
ncbi:MAG: DUF4097 domain-containing protein [Gemmatimonadetes bacterium]|nr:DUF4097 domain-containing protein [Gemmatimonadota bacterium]